MQTLKMVLKIMGWFFIVIVIFVMAGIGLLKCFEREVFRSTEFESSQLFLTAIGCPKDFWLPLLDQRLDLKKGNDHFEFNFRSIYVGPKDINVATGRNKTLTEKTFGGGGFIPGFKFKIKIYEGEKIIWRSETQKDMRPYFNNDEVGFLIGEVNCPREIPLDSDLRLVIDVIQHDADFENGHSLRLKVTNNIKAVAE